MMLDLYEKLKSKREKLSVIGLGYVGMPIAVEFSLRGVSVVGFDINNDKIESYKNGIDVTKEVGNEMLKNCGVAFTSDETKLREAKFHIVSVPTPINNDHTPDLNPVEVASEILGRNMAKGSVIVFESTVYPGVTEDICVPILERESGLICGRDFFVGYSPERINPGDKIHKLKNIIKVVSGMDKYTLDCIAKVYEIVIDAGVYKAESIKVAEAAKVIENSQRDINIAFMNEISCILHRMGIDTHEVLNAAKTKWNFMNFVPGLVGGHCIGVDPYYIAYKAEQLGWHSQIITAGRRINDDMGRYVAENLIKCLIKAEKVVNSAKVAIFGITFKENCSDYRNSKCIDIINALNEYGISPIVVDPYANYKEIDAHYSIKLANIEDIHSMDAIIVTVAHDIFREISSKKIDSFFANGNKVLLDLKGIYKKNEYIDRGYVYWRL